MSASTEPEVPVEKPDPEAAKRPSSGGELPEGGPVDDPASAPDARPAAADAPTPRA